MKQRLGREYKLREGKKLGLKAVFVRSFCGEKWQSKEKIGQVQTKREFLVLKQSSGEHFAAIGNENPRNVVARYYDLYSHSNLRWVYGKYRPDYHPKP